MMMTKRRRWRTEMKMLIMTATGKVMFMTLISSYGKRTQTDALLKDQVKKNDVDV